MKTTFDLLRKANGPLLKVQSLLSYYQGGKMLPIPCISEKEKLVYLIKGACKTKLFFFSALKENIQRKAKTADLSDKGLALGGNKVNM